MALLRKQVLSCCCWKMGHRRNHPLPQPALITLKKNQDLSELLRSSKLVTARTWFQMDFKVSKYRALLKAVLPINSWHVVQCTKHLWLWLALWLWFGLFSSYQRLFACYVHYYFIKCICINATNISPFVHSADTSMLSTSSVTRYVFGKRRFSSESGRVTGFCPHGVYIILVEEMNDK